MSTIEVKVLDHGEIGDDWEAVLITLPKLWIHAPLVEGRKVLTHWWSLKIGGCPCAYLGTPDTFALWIPCATSSFEAARRFANAPDGGIQ